jgi:hypothetical protein
MLLENKNAVIYWAGGYLNLRKNRRMSSSRRSGASWAAQWLPRSNSDQCTMLAWSRSANLRIGRKSKAKLARPMGIVVGPVGSAACLFS